MKLVLVLVAALQVLSPKADQENTATLHPSQTIAYSEYSADTIYDNRFVTIDNIVVLGNRITQSSIILREIKVKKGQTFNYQDLLDQLKQDELRVNNLRLFNTVSLRPIEVDNDRFIIVVEVTERWYIFPVPIFDLVDRNFNVWWEQQNRDLSRVNYGLKLYQQNFRGRNEKLKLTAQFGFTKQFGINYNIPYLDRSQQHGLILDVNYRENKNIAIRTENHIQEFYDSEEVLYQSFSASATYVYRPTFQSFHFLTVDFSNNQINDTVPDLNSNYFRFDDLQQKFFQLRYAFTRDERDVQAYPLRGFHFEGFIQKQGLGIYNDLNITELTLRYARYMDLKKNWFLSNYSSGTVSTPNEQPYSAYRAVGYRKNAVRGYELYLIEGPQSFVNKTTLKKRILSLEENLGIMPVKQFRHFPLDIYLKTYFDWGYVRNYDNYAENRRFSDTFLAGSGLGLDIHTFYDMVIRLEYSINMEMERGFFFHLKREF